MLDDTQVIRRARTLLQTLPNVGFSIATFEELGRAVQSKRPWADLSPPLRGTLLILTRDFCEALQTLDVEELLAASDIQEETIKATPLPSPAMPLSVSRDKENMFGDDVPTSELPKVQVDQTLSVADDIARAVDTGARDERRTVPTPLEEVASSR